MSIDAKLVARRRQHEVSFGHHPGAMELLAAYEGLLDEPTYSECIARLKLLMEGEKPFPDLNPYEALVRSAGHEMAAAEVLKPTSVLGQIFLGRSAYSENYYSLHMVIAARLWRGPGYSFSEQELALFYSTMDRLLRGGRDWATIQRVPAANREFYQALFTTSDYLNFSSSLSRVMGVSGTTLIGPDYRKTDLFAGAGQNLLAVAAAVKNGHRKVDIKDAMEAAEAYLSFYRVDPSSLPPVIREGRSGYEAS